jgi:hypothetical protein
MDDRQDPCQQLRGRVLITMTDRVARDVKVGDTFGDPYGNTATIVGRTELITLRVRDDSDGTEWYATFAPDAVVNADSLTDG